jgi:hypothetical protein
MPNDEVAAPDVVISRQFIDVGCSVPVAGRQDLKTLCRSGRCQQPVRVRPCLRDGAQRARQPAVCRPCPGIGDCLKRVMDYTELGGCPLPEQ